MDPQQLEKAKALAHELDRRWYSRYGRWTFLLVLEWGCYALALCLALIDLYLISRGSFIVLGYQQVDERIRAALIVEVEELTVFLYLVYALLALAVVAVYLLGRTARSSRRRILRMHELRQAVDALVPGG